MASTLHKLAFTAPRTSYRTPCRRKPHLLTPGIPRYFRCHSRLLASKADPPSSSSSTATPPPGSTRQPFHFDVNDLDPDERASYTSLSPADQAEWRADAQTTHDYYTGPDFAAAMSATSGPAGQDIARALALQKPPKPRPRVKQGFMAMGEDDAENIGPDPEYEGDDVTSLGHGELEQHREMREYARLAVWELPLLYERYVEGKGKGQGQGGFEPPPRGNVLRFRYTTYMGEQHPAAKKIVVEWTTRDVAREAGLSEAQRIKLVKLVGVRYNPDSDLVKMSSERFETAAQNKRYLGDLVEKLIREAMDGEDLFEDVPLDFRHHKPKRFLEFPEQWKLDKEKRQRLGEERKQREVLEASRVKMGARLIEGREVVREALRAQQLPKRDESQVLLEQQQGGRRRAAPPRLR